MVVYGCIQCSTHTLNRGRLYLESTLSILYPTRHEMFVGWERRMEAIAVVSLRALQAKLKSVQCLRKDLESVICG